MSKAIQFTVFSKVWKHLSLDALARQIREMGFDGIELPVRPGFQVQPDRIEQGLLEAVRIFGQYGLKIASVAAEPDARTIRALGEAGVPLLRILVNVPPESSYMSTMDEAVAQFESLVPILDEAGVTLGIQNHCNREVSSTMGLRYLVYRFDPKHVGAVLDIGHCGLAGETPDLALDMIESHLCLVNFKNAFRYRTNAPEAPKAEWGIHWTTGRHGLADWQGAAEELKKRQYTGDICLTAEYDEVMQGDLDRLIREDLEYARSLFV